jgi:hypothetical protein
LSLISISAAIAAAVSLAALPAAAESTWDQIKRTGQLRYGATDYPPNWYRDKELQNAGKIEKNNRQTAAAVERQIAELQKTIASQQVDLSRSISYRPGEYRNAAHVTACHGAVRRPVWRWAPAP